MSNPLLDLINAQRFLDEGRGGPAEFLQHAGIRRFTARHKNIAKEIIDYRWVEGFRKYYDSISGDFLDKTDDDGNLFAENVMLGLLRIPLGKWFNSKTRRLVNEDSRMVSSSIKKEMVINRIILPFTREQDFNGMLERHKIEFPLTDNPQIFRQALDAVVQIGRRSTYLVKVHWSNDEWITIATLMIEADDSPETVVAKINSIFDDLENRIQMESGVTNEEDASFDAIEISTAILNDNGGCGNVRKKAQSKAFGHLLCRGWYSENNNCLLACLNHAENNVKLSGSQMVSFKRNELKLADDELISAKLHAQKCADRYGTRIYFFNEVCEPIFETSGNWAYECKIILAGDHFWLVVNDDYSEKICPDCRRSYKLKHTCSESMQEFLNYQLRKLQTKIVRTPVETKAKASDFEYMDIGELKPVWEEYKDENIEKWIEVVDKEKRQAEKRAIERLDAEADDEDEVVHTLTDLAVAIADEHETKSNKSADPELRCFNAFISRYNKSDLKRKKPHMSWGSGWIGIIVDKRKNDVYYPLFLRTSMVYDVEAHNQDGRQQSHAVGYWFRGQHYTYYGADSMKDFCRRAFVAGFNPKTERRETKPKHLVGFNNSGYDSFLVLYEMLEHSNYLAAGYRPELKKIKSSAIWKNVEVAQRHGCKGMTFDMTPLGKCLRELPRHNAEEMRVIDERVEFIMKGARERFWEEMNLLGELGVLVVQNRKKDDVQKSFQNCLKDSLRWDDEMRLMRSYRQKTIDGYSLHDRDMCRVDKTRNEILPLIKNQLKKAPCFIKKGSRLMKLEFNNVKSLDINQYVVGSLAGACKDFELKTAKTMFPHQFAKCEEDTYYQGPMPDFKIFGSKDRQKIVKEWGSYEKYCAEQFPMQRDEKTGGLVRWFDFEATTRKYLKNDVQATLELYIKVAKALFTSTGLDMRNYITLPASAFGEWRQMLPEDSFMGIPHTQHEYKHAEGTITGGRTTPIIRYFVSPQKDLTYDEIIEYLIDNDFVSMYATAMGKGDYPMGNSTPLRENQIKTLNAVLESYDGDLVKFKNEFPFGSYRVDVFPSKNILLPPIAARDEKGNTVWDLQNRTNQYYCRTDIMTGLKYGYKFVLKGGYAYWMIDTKKYKFKKYTKIFKPFIDKHYQGKMHQDSLKSQWKIMQNAIAEKKIAIEKNPGCEDFEQDLADLIEKAEEMEKPNKSLRSMYKLMCNSLYGKCGQKAARSDTFIINSAEKLDEFFAQYGWTDLHRIEKDKIIVTGDRLDFEGSVSKPIQLSAEILAQSRVMMNDLLDLIDPGRLHPEIVRPLDELLANTIYYTDTDSAFVHSTHMDRIKHMVVKEGALKQLGELDDELEGGKIIEAIFLAPKTYALKYIMPDNTIHYKFRDKGKPRHALTWAVYVFALRLEQTEITEEMLNKVSLDEIITVEESKGRYKKGERYVEHVVEENECHYTYRQRVEDDWSLGETEVEYQLTMFKKKSSLKTLRKKTEKNGLTEDEKPYTVYVDEKCTRATRDSWNRRLYVDGDKINTTPMGFSDCVDEVAEPQNLKLLTYSTPEVDMVHTREYCADTGLLFFTDADECEDHMDVSGDLFLVLYQGAKYTCVPNMKVLQNVFSEEYLKDDFQIFDEESDDYVGFDQMTVDENDEEFERIVPVCNNSDDCHTPVHYSHLTSLQQIERACEKNERKMMITEIIEHDKEMMGWKTNTKMDVVGKYNYISKSTNRVAIGVKVYSPRLDCYLFTTKEKRNEFAKTMEPGCYYFKYSTYTFGVAKSAKKFWKNMEKFKNCENHVHIEMDMNGPFCFYGDIDKFAHKDIDVIGCVKEKVFELYKELGFELTDNQFKTASASGMKLNKKTGKVEYYHSWRFAIENGLQFENVESLKKFWHNFSKGRERELGDDGLGFDMGVYNYGKTMRATGSCKIKDKRRILKGDVMRFNMEGNDFYCLNHLDDAPIAAEVEDAVPSAVPIYVRRIARKHNYQILFQIETLESSRFSHYAIDTRNFECPFAGRIHNDTRARIRWNKITSEVVLKCSNDDKCKHRELLLSKTNAQEDEWRATCDSRKAERKERLDEIEAADKAQNREWADEMKKKLKLQGRMDEFTGRKMTARKKRDCQQQSVNDLRKEMARWRQLRDPNDKMDLRDYCPVDEKKTLPALPVQQLFVRDDVKRGELLADNGFDFVGNYSTPTGNISPQKCIAKSADPVKAAVASISGTSSGCIKANMYEKETALYRHIFEPTGMTEEEALNRMEIDLYLRPKCLKGAPHDKFMRIGKLHFLDPKGKKTPCFVFRDFCTNQIWFGKQIPMYEYACMRGLQLVIKTTDFYFTAMENEKEFATMNAATPDGARFFYELLPSGNKRVPAWDIDYCSDEPDPDGTVIILQELVAQYKADWGTDVDAEDVSIIDGSRWKEKDGKKFYKNSVHVYICNGDYFEDNDDERRYIQHQKLSLRLYDYFSDGRIDGEIYTKNRAFRLAGSAKQAQPTCVLEGSLTFRSPTDADKYENKLDVSKYQKTIKAKYFTKFVNELKASEY